MGYGPPDRNRFGWCWRNEHGSGTRMTPYFRSEVHVDGFHTYLITRQSELSSTLPEAIRQQMDMLHRMTFNSTSSSFDLRTTKLSEINKMAEDYAKTHGIKVICNPVAETIKEFYGIDQEGSVGYEDPTPYYWEVQSNDEESPPKKKEVNSRRSSRNKTLKQKS